MSSPTRQQPPPRVVAALERHFEMQQEVFDLLMTVVISAVRCEPTAAGALELKVLAANALIVVNETIKRGGLKEVRNAAVQN